MDLAIDAEKAGLRAPSKVHMKLFMLDNRLVLRELGTLSELGQRALAAVVQKVLVA